MDKAIMPRVLMIAHHFPPMIGPASLRALKFAKYLPEYKWRPVVLTLQEVDTISTDDALLAQLPEVQIHRTKSLEPFRFKRNLRGILRRGTCSSSDGEPPPRPSFGVSLMMRLVAILQRWLRFPDRKLGWLPFAFSAGKRLITQERIDTIYATGGPYTSFILGYMLKKTTGHPLVLDYRDSWSQNTRPPYPSRLHIVINEWMEGLVLQEADAIIGARNSYLDDIVKRYGIETDKLTVITNGFDAEDFKGLHRNGSGKFTISYTGYLTEREDPTSFLHAVRELLNEHPDIETELQIIIAGNFSEGFAYGPTLLHDLGLDKLTTVLGYIPHRDCLQLMLDSEILLLLLWKNPAAVDIFPVKMFEYMAARRPILALMPKESTAASLIEAAKAGVVLDPEDVTGIKNELYKFYLGYKQGELKVNSNWALIEQFDRKHLAGKLARCLDSVCGTSVR